MKTNTPNRDCRLRWIDAGVFLLTAATCTLFLTAACIFGRPAATIADPIPELALPHPPGPLELARTTKPAPAHPPVIGVQPIFGMCWEMPALELSSETLASAAIQPDKYHATVLDRRIPFYGIIVQVADRYEVDPHLIRAIILAESGYNPKAKSKKGARGLMQLMPSTAKALGVQDIYDPEENIDGGVRYFRSLLDRFDGDVQLALAAYNAGSRHVRNYEGIPPFKATRHYIKKVLKFHEKFKAEKLRELRRLA